MTKTKTLYSVCIPVYNSQKSLEELFDRIKKTFKKITSQYEVIFVDDGSQDKSWQVLKKIKVKYKNVKIIKFTRNFGQHNALFCAFKYTQGKYIITLDDDLQKPPEEILKLINALKENPQVDGVLGVPKKRKDNILRKWGSLLIDLTNSIIFKKPLHLKPSSFRLIKKQIINKILKANQNNPNPVVGPLLFQTTLNLINIKVKHDKRKYGKSQYSLTKIINLSLSNIINFSTLPLKIVSIMGLLTSLFSFSLGVYFILRKALMGVGPQGWTSLLVINLFFFGIVLLSMGIIGEYLIRIIKQTSQSPTYIIKMKKT